MNKISIFLIVLLLPSVIATAQEFQGMTQKTGFIIISASKNYNAAKKKAEKASTKLKYKLDLRGLEPNSKIGLSFSKEDCEDNGIEFPFNVQRGRGGDARFVSVEYSDIYKGFSKGLYLVVVANYAKGSPNLKQTLKRVKKYFKRAYVKYTDIYMGCIN